MDEDLYHHDRLNTIASRYASYLRQGSSLGEALCNTCVDVLKVPGAAVMLLSDHSHVTLGVSDEVMSHLEELQQTLGEGPCVDAYRRNTAVLVPDLTDRPNLPWVAFPTAALDAGAASVYGFPLPSTRGPIGALNLYSPQSGGLAGDQYQDALILAELISQAVLAVQAGAEDLLGELYDTSRNQTQINQAAGMVSAQLDLPVADAMRRLRAHAYATSRPLSEVAADIIARRLRLEP